MVLPDFAQIFASPTQDTDRYKRLFRILVLLSLITFPGSSTIIFKSTLQSYNPKKQTSSFALLGVSLAATKEIAFAFVFFLQLLRCFSSLRLPLHDLCNQ